MAVANPLVARWLPDALIAQQETGVPASLLLADIGVESGGVPGQTSSTGAGGLTQFEPATAAAYGVKVGTTPADELSQIVGQARYLVALGVKSNPTAALEGYYTGTPGDTVGASYAASVLAAQPAYEGLTGEMPRALSGSAAAPAPTSSASSSSSSYGGLGGWLEQALLTVGLLGAGAVLAALGAKHLLDQTGAKA